MGTIAIIGGTGVYDPTILEHPEEVLVETPYGPTKYLKGTYRGIPLLFMRRHGADHSIPPHLINYRANIWALKKSGVDRILATTAVGSARMEIPAGAFVLCDQFLDFTKGRISTFYDGGERGVVHLDVTEPYCPALRAQVYQVGQEMGLDIRNGGVYVCTEGPRFESPAEVRMFAQLGGDVLGMTNVPEVTLAAEAEMHYMTISMVSNYGAGLSPEPLTHQEVLEAMDASSKKLKELLLRSVEVLAHQESSVPCACAHNLAGYGGFTL